MQVIAGIVLIIVAVVLWLSHISVEHALAIFIGLVGLILALTYVFPFGTYSRRNRRAAP